MTILLLNQNNLDLDLTIPTTEEEFICSSGCVSYQVKNIRDVGFKLNLFAQIHFIDEQNKNKEGLKW